MGNGVNKPKSFSFKTETESTINPEMETFLNEISKTVLFDEAVRKLPKAISYLLEFKKLDGMSQYRLMNFLRHYSGPLKTTTSDQRSSWVQQLSDEGVLPFCMNFWRSMFSSRLFTKRAENEMRNFRMLIGITWNCTEISPIWCRNFTKSDGFRVMLDSLNNECLSVAKLEQDKTNVNRMYVAHASGVILRNVLYLYPDAKTVFRQENGLKICQKFTTSSLEILKCTIFMVLAYGVNEDEYDLIASQEDMLKYMIRLLNECANDDKGHVAKLYPFSATEMLDALNKLAENDENKLKFVKLKILEPLSKLIQSPLNDDELNLTIKLLWILAFKEENKEIINGNEFIMKYLRKYANETQNANKSIVNSAKGALFTLQCMQLKSGNNQEKVGQDKEVAFLGGTVSNSEDSEQDQDADAIEQTAPRSLSDADLFDLGGPLATGPIGPPETPKNSGSNKKPQMSRSDKDKDETLTTTQFDNFRFKSRRASEKTKKNKKESEKRDKRKSSVTPIVKSPRSLKQKVTDQHIMISYQWNYKPLVLKLSESLKSAGHKVWVDVEQMTGSTLEAMAEAIENAWMVLICLSESYKLSPSCRTEAEYTYKMRKDFIPLQVEENYKPTGWLGILIGTKLYFNMSSEESVSYNMQNLLKEIKSRNSVTVNSTTTVEPPIDNFHKVPTTGNQNSNSVEMNQPYLKWSKEEVIKWLKENQLDELTVVFGHFDGQLLSGLRKMYYKAPLIYYSTLKTDLKITDLLTLIKFTNALENV